MRISDWSSDVCSSDLTVCDGAMPGARQSDSVATMHVLLRVRSWQLSLLQTVQARIVSRLMGQELVVSSLFDDLSAIHDDNPVGKIGRASCRERVCQYV